MWMMPLHLHVNQKSDYDDDDENICFKLWIRKYLQFNAGIFCSSKTMLTIYIFARLNICSGYMYSFEASPRDTSYEHHYILLRGEIRKTSKFFG